MYPVSMKGFVWLIHHGGESMVVEVWGHFCIQREASRQQWGQVLNLQGPHPTPTDPPFPSGPPQNPIKVLEPSKMVRSAGDQAKTIAHSNCHTTFYTASSFLSLDHSSKLLRIPLPKQRQRPESDSRFSNHPTSDTILDLLFFIAFTNYLTKTSK